MVCSFFSANVIACTHSHSEQFCTGWRIGSTQFYLEQKQCILGNPMLGVEPTSQHGPVSTGSDRNSFDLEKFTLSLSVCCLYITSSSAIAERPRCGGALAKYKSENRASNIALSYSVDVDESPFYCFMSPYLYLMQNFATFRH